MHTPPPLSNRIASIKLAIYRRWLNVSFFSRLKLMQKKIALNTLNYRWEKRHEWVSCALWRILAYFKTFVICYDCCQHLSFFLCQKKIQSKCFKIQDLLQFFFLKSIVDILFYDIFTYHIYWHSLGNSFNRIKQFSFIDRHAWIISA